MSSDLRIASPCTADWELMTGDDRVRHCAQCNLNVYNFGELTQSEIDELVAKREGRLCARMYRRADGTMITKDCPVGFQIKVRRVSRIAVVALAGAMVIPAMAQTAAPTQPVQAQAVSHSVDVRILVTDPNEAVIPNASVSLMNAATGMKYKLSTDSRGRAGFTGVYAGDYKIEIVSKGFRTFTENLSVSAGETVDLEAALVLGSNGGVMVLQSTAPPAEQSAGISATLNVAVIDATDTAIANAKVTLVNQSTKAKVEKTSDGRGNLRFDDVAPATYTVEVTAVGFRTVKRTNIRLEPGQASGLKILLPLGESVFD